MKVGTETKLKARLVSGPGCRGSADFDVSGHRGVLALQRAAPAPALLCRLLPPGTPLKLLQGEESGGR